MAAVLLVATAVAACSSSTPGTVRQTSAALVGGVGAAHTTVVCRSATGSVSPDLPVLERRAEREAAAARVHAQADTVTVRLPGRRAPSDAETLCSSAQLDFHGVIAPPVPVTCTAGCSASAVSDAAAAGHIALPRDETAFAALPVPTRSQLTRALARYDCSGRHAGRTGQVVCGKGADYGASTAFVAMLVSPAILTSADVAKADAIAPSTSGSAVWSVALTLDGRGAAAWSRYTTAHNTAGRDAAGGVSQCGPAGYPCADFVAVALDGAVITAPVTTAPITGAVTQISGGFTENTAKQLARDLSAGGLPVPLTVVSVQVTG